MHRLQVSAAASGLLILLLATPAAFADEDGLHYQPHVGFSHGDHHADLRLEFRYRWADWKAFSQKSDAFHGLRTRFALDYRFRKRFRLFAQGQQTAVLGLSGNSSGAGGLYRANNNGKDNPGSVRVSQLFAQFDPTPDAQIRVGREFVKLGTLVEYDEPNWKFLKAKRLSQRLLGTVGWTHGERAYDGVTARLGLDGHLFHAFVSEPTTGVFVVDKDAYKSQKHVIVGGLDWTAERGTFFDDSEVGGFLIGYSDDRNPAKVAGLFGNITVVTLGGSWLGVYPAGPGRVDALLWGAFQFGKYKDAGPTSGVRNRDQRAGALIAEVGYQLPDVWSKPWLRFGVNWASGDSNLDDDDRNTFFNILPTNHMYYGYLDQFAFQNLIDLLVQLKLAPVGKLGLELAYHRFWLQEDADFRWSGTGAFSRVNLGYVRNAQNGSTDVGHELDLVASYPLNRWLTVSAGYAHLWGGKVFNGLPDDDASFGYVQAAFKY
ncbi:MAG: alginate export family protein [Myxococcota bacterium]